MKNENPKQDALKALLRKAYLEKEKLPVGERWEQNAMRAIRRLPHPRGSNHLAAFEALVWKFAPAAAALIVLFTFALFRMDLIPDSEVVRYLFNGFNEDGIARYWMI